MRRRHAGLLAVLAAVLGALGCAGMSAGDRRETMALVDETCRDVRKDADGTFQKITAGQPPYVKKGDPSVFVFVYDTDVVVVAHPDKVLVGRNEKDLADAEGKMFRAGMVAGALKNGWGWTEYLYAFPKDKTPHGKATYYRLTVGSDGKKYVVCSGRYVD